MTLSSCRSGSNCKRFEREAKCVNRKLCYPVDTKKNHRYRIILMQFLEAALKDCQNIIWKNCDFSDAM